jgi:hypothetical protein
MKLITRIIMPHRAFARRIEFKKRPRPFPVATLKTLVRV